MQRGMKMYKRDLVNFIEKVEQKAVASVQKRYDAVIQEKKDEVFSKYKTDIARIQKKINAATTELIGLQTEMTEDVEVAYSSNWHIRYGINYLTGIEEEIYKTCSFNGEVQKIVAENQKEIQAVKDNYFKVRMTVNKMSSAKKIAEYLTDLGFDLSSLEEVEETSLVAEIDKSKLFVCGENK